MNAAEHIEPHIRRAPALEALRELYKASAPYTLAAGHGAVTTRHRGTPLGDSLEQEFGVIESLAADIEAVSHQLASITGEEN